MRKKIDYWLVYCYIFILTCAVMYIPSSAHTKNIGGEVTSTRFFDILYVWRKFVANALQLHLDNSCGTCDTWKVSDGSYI